MAQCGNCGSDASVQTIQHLTDAEYAALSAQFLPIDGYAVKSVFACDDCADAAGERFYTFCEHPEPKPAVCPVCKAVGDAPCTLKSGDPRWMWHKARTTAQPVADVCRHAHRPDCAVFSGCQCTSSDEAPVRPRVRTAAPAPDPDVTGLTVPVSVAQAVLAEAGYPWPSVVRAWSCWTQDTRPAVGAEVYTFEATGTLERDEHGHPVTADIIVPLQQG